MSVRRCDEELLSVIAVSMLWWRPSGVACHSLRVVSQVYCIDVFECNVWEPDNNRYMLWIIHGSERMP